MTQTLKNLVLGNFLKYQKILSLILHPRITLNKIYKLEHVRERRVFYVEVGNTPPEEARRHIEKIKEFNR